MTNPLPASIVIIHCRPLTPNALYATDIGRSGKYIFPPRLFRKSGNKCPFGWVRFLIQSFLICSPRAGRGAAQSDGAFWKIEGAIKAWSAMLHHQTRWEKVEGTFSPNGPVFVLKTGEVVPTFWYRSHSVIRYWQSGGRC